MENYLKHVTKFLIVFCYISLILSLLETEYQQAVAWFFACSGWCCVYLKETIERMNKEIRSLDEAIKILERKI